AGLSGMYARFPFSHTLETISYGQIFVFILTGHFGSRRDYVLRACDDSATYQESPSEPEPRRNGQDRETIAFAHIQNRLFSSTYDARWASSSSIQEPNCVTFEDHGL